MHSAALSPINIVIGEVKCQVAAITNELNEIGDESITAVF
jgi:hypothetical protein